MLMSVFLQTYENWLILIRDDMSTTSGTVDIIKTVCERHCVPWLIHGTKMWGRGEYKDYYDESTTPQDPKVYLVINDEKFWEVKNVLAMINDPVVQEDDIICRLDGDDFITNLHALDIISQAYKETNCEILWTKHTWNLNERGNVSKPLPQGTRGKDVYQLCKAGWWGPSHLKTFRKHLLSGVKEENYYGPDGTYAKRAGDRYIILPALYKADTKWCFLDRFMYHYSINDVPETYSSDDAKFQKMEADYLSARGFI